jgi:ABC-type Fe3+/spermidine/putrescine transport system ATPase subunit
MNYHKVNLPFNELNEILIDLEERKGLIDANEHMVKIKGAGMEQIEQTKEHPEKPTKDFPAQIVNNYNTFNAPVGGVQQQTQDSNQYINQEVHINPDFNSAIKSLVELTKNSSLGELDKEEAILNIERVNQLAKKEKTPDVVEHAQKKINLLKSALEVGELAIRVAPYIETLSKFFG